MSGKIELIEGMLLSTDGVGPVTVSAHTAPDPIGLGPGILYQPLDMSAMGNGDVLTFSHAISLCGTCGRPEGICECWA